MKTIEIIAILASNLMKMWELWLAKQEDELKRKQIEDERTRILQAIKARDADALRSVFMRLPIDHPKA